MYATSLDSLSINSHLKLSESMTEVKAETSKPIIQASPYKLADELVGKMFQNSNVLDDGYSFSFKTVMKLVLLLSIGEIKDFVRKILASIVPLIRMSPMFAVFCITKLSQFKLSSLRSKPPVLMIERVPDNHKLIIEVSDQFMLALYCYINNSPQCKFDRIVSKAGVGNMKDRFTTEKISGITVGKVSIMDYIDYDISMRTGEPINLIIAEPPSKNLKSIRSYVLLFNKDQQKMLNENIEGLKERKSVEVFMEKVRAESKFNELDIALKIVSKYPEMDLTETCYAFGVLCLMYTRHTSTRGVKPLAARLKNKEPCFFDPNHIHAYESNKPETETVMYDILKDVSCIKSSSSETTRVFGHLFDNHVQEGIDVLKPRAEGPKKLSIEIPFEESSESVNTLLKGFIDDVCQYQRSEASAIVCIKIYCLLLETKVTTSEKPNPKYAQWEEQKKVLDQYRDLTDEIGYRAPKVDISKIKIPAKTITVESSAKVIVNKLLNETKKSLDTLYLRKADMDKLLTSLDQFRNKKEMLEALGLPNKLNILLYGQPGTGKSTAIQTVATYLGRDIYYLDLKNAVTNQDLQTMFEYVNKNVQNGGIIVIEDIDAMTDVVLKRETSSEARVNQLVSSGDANLSLEYLLNILQGTLTLDDSIFIVTTNHIDHLDPAFYRDGRFDVKIELKLADHYQIQSIYQKFLNRRIPDALLARIPENKYAPASVIFHIKDYLFAAEVSDEEILARFME